MFSNCSAATPQHFFYAVSRQSVDTDQNIFHALSGKSEDILNALRAKSPIRLFGTHYLIILHAHRSWHVVLRDSVSY